jgi:hypothetical protein
MARSDEPHVIRLRGPWQYGMRLPPSAAHGCPEIKTGELRLPIRVENVVPDEPRGRFELRRRFNWREPLGYRESLWVVVTVVALPDLWIELNGESLGRIEPANPLPAAWDITARVMAHNELRLLWDLDAALLRDNVSWVEVQLEVRLDVGPPG